MPVMQMATAEDYIRMGIVTIELHPGLINDSTRFIVDDGLINEIHENYFVLTRRIKKGDHKVIIERPGFPTKELNFYFDGVTTKQMDVWYYNEWVKETTNLKFPEGTKEIQVFQDKKAIYRMIARADGIYASSSQDLKTWSSLEKLSINEKSHNDLPRLIQDSGTGIFHLFWRSDRSPSEPLVIIKSNLSTNSSEMSLGGVSEQIIAVDDIWESTSENFQNWSLPEKVIAVPGLPSRLDIYQEKNGRFRLFGSEGYTNNSGNGQIWAHPDTTKFYKSPISNGYPYFHDLFHYALSNGRYLYVYNDCYPTGYSLHKDKMNFLINQNGKEFQKTGELELKNDQMSYATFGQIIELEDGEYAFVWDAPNYRCLSKSKDLIKWS